MKLMFFSGLFAPTQQKLLRMLRRGVIFLFAKTASQALLLHGSEKFCKKCENFNLELFQIRKVLLPLQCQTKTNSKNNLKR